MWKMGSLAYLSNTKPVGFMDAVVAYPMLEKYPMKMSHSQNRDSDILITVASNGTYKIAYLKAGAYS